MNVTFPDAARICNLESKIQGAMKRKTLWMPWRQQQNQLPSNLQSAYAALQFIEGHEVFFVFVFLLVIVWGSHWFSQLCVA